MADVEKSIEIIQSGLRRIPSASLSKDRTDLVDVYLLLLSNFIEFAQIQSSSFRSLKASSSLERRASEVEAAVEQDDWDDVLRKAYASIVSLPGDTGWRPIRNIPPPK